MENPEMNVDKTTPLKTTHFMVKTEPMSDVIESENHGIQPGNHGIHSENHGIQSENHHGIQSENLGIQSENNGTKSENQGHKDRLARPENNPWDVESLQAFLCLKCPECVFDTQEKDSFQNHAVQNHPLSIVFFGKTLKEENGLGNNFKDHFLADRAANRAYHDEEDVVWEPDYLDYCESKLEEIDEEVDYEYVEYNDEIKQERKPKMPKVKREPGSKSHRCEICAGEFSNSSHLNRHIINVHKGQTPFQCTLCESSFTKSFGLNMHMKIVHKEERAIDKIRKCPICEEEFSNSSDLNRHILSVHEGQTPYKCTMCESSFAQNFELTHHRKTVHEKEKKQKIPCPICEVEFSSSSHLNRHILSVHKGMTPYQCTLCESRFSVRFELSKHMKTAHPTHEKEKHNKCYICSASFSKKSHLDRHVASVHANKKPFQSMAPFQSDTTKIEPHQIKTEAGETMQTQPGSQPHHPFKCEWANCHLAFESQSVHDQHVYIVHQNATIGGVTKVKCITCKMPFKSTVTDKAMWKHVRKCKFEEVLCQNCGKVFMSKYKHSIHQKDCLEKSQKPLECSICSKLFSTSRLLERHTRCTHGEKKHICEHCGKGFKDNQNLKNHVQYVHFKIKRFSCELCEKAGIEKSFTHFQGLKEHIIALHTHVRPINCDKCDKTFKLQQSLLKHVRNVHEGVRPHECKLCPKTFFLSNDLKKHVERIHEHKREVCPHCGLLFSKLKQHVKRAHTAEGLQSRKIPKPTPSMFNLH